MTNLLEEDITMNDRDKPITMSDLAQLFAAMGQNNRQQNTRVKLPIPAFFIGTRDFTTVNNWISAVERYLKYYDERQDNYVPFAVSLLKDKALTWWDRIENTMQLTSWNHFKVEFRAEFVPELVNRVAREKLRNLKQINSVNTYIDQFQDVLLELNITEDEAVDRFVSGLKPKLGRYVSLQNPMTLAAATKAARTFEMSNGLAMGGGVSEPINGGNREVLDDPMDLSVINQQKLLINLLRQQQQQGQHRTYSDNKTNKDCYNCGKPGHLARDCWSKKKPFNNKPNYNNHRQSNNNGNRNSDRSWKHKFNALLQEYDAVINGDAKKNNSINNTNKNLIDFSSDDESSAYYPVLTPVRTDNEEDNELLESDIKFLNNINNTPSKLPLYQALVGGSEFKVLIDSGATTCFVHPKLISHALHIKNIRGKSVETADGKQSVIDKQIKFRMFLGDNLEYQEIVSACVFEPKFDVILGRNWLKSAAPIPD
jgi:hypothetical protein